ncbi:hypothetical protein AAC387_Pa05g3409 [Persea americana]
MIIFPLELIRLTKKKKGECHAFFVTPARTGTNQRIKLVVIDASSGYFVAPFQGSSGAATREVAGVAQSADTRRRENRFEIKGEKFKCFRSGFGREKIRFLGEEMGDLGGFGKFTDLARGGLEEQDLQVERGGNP